MLSHHPRGIVALVVAVLFSIASARAEDPPHPVMEWVKRHPLPDSKRPSPAMGYESAYGYDPHAKLLIRYGGHNQGGGGEQNSEIWTYDLAKDVWKLHHPNDAPPGVCCGQQNVFHDALGLYVRFPSFSGSHGWQSFREIYLKDSSAWTFDAGSSTWTAMRPCPEVWPGPLRGAAYDPEHEVIVLHGGEGSRHGTVAYDLYSNTWHDLKPQGDAPPVNLSQPGFTNDVKNRVFVLFGSQFGEEPQTWTYDLRQNQWQVVETTGSPPTNKSSPVLAADTRNGVVLCTVLPGEEQHDVQTWVLDVARKKWTQLELAEGPDDSGARNRNLLYLADQNLFVLENRTHTEQSNEQQIWTFRYADAPAPPPAPQRPIVKTEAGAVTLTWDAADAGGDAVDLYRAEAHQPWVKGFSRVAEGITEGQFRDEQVEQNASYVYRLRNVNQDETEDAESYLAHTRLPLVSGLHAAVLGAKQVELKWIATSREDVKGYHVERAVVSMVSSQQIEPIARRYNGGSALAAGRIHRIGEFERLTDKPLAAPGFLDDSIDLTAGPVEPDEPFLVERPLAEEHRVADAKPYRFAVYAYRVRAVNHLGAESGPSDYVLTIPSAVQDVYAREEGESATRLRWRENPEAGLEGYLVYRHEGRWNKDPIQRLTPEPNRTTEFLDKSAGAETRRYEIVAVDALGQEGMPSQPVWSRREWRKYYEAFVDEWHQ